MASESKNLLAKTEFFLTIASWLLLVSSLGIFFVEWWFLSEYSLGQFIPLTCRCLHLHLPVHLYIFKCTKATEYKASTSCGMCNQCKPHLPMILLFYLRGSGQEVGRSCHILEFKGKKVMVCTSVHYRPMQIKDVATDSQQLFS